MSPGLIVHLAAFALHPPAGPEFALETVGRGVVVETAPFADLDLRPVDPPAGQPPFDCRDLLPTSRPRPPRPAARHVYDPAGDGPGFSRLAGAVLHGLSGLSGSGMGTHGGERRPPIAFAAVTDRATGRTMRLFIVLASGGGFINRSGVAWGGDHVPGVRVAGRPHGRDNADGAGERMTAEVHVRLPEADRVHLVFVGYDDRGRRVPAFGPEPFDLSIARVVVLGREKAKDAAAAQTGNAAGP